MNKSVLAITLITLTLLSYRAEALILESSAAFTLRSRYGANGPAEDMDDTWGDGGFQGFLTNEFFTDWTFAEFDLLSLSGPVNNATLNWVSDDRSINPDNSVDDTIYLYYYSADGLSSLSDWSTATTYFTSFNAGSSPYSIDITSLINENIGVMDYIGFRWSIDPYPWQAFIDRDQPPVINYEFAPVPEPATILLLGTGFLGGIVSLRGKFRKK